MRGGPADAGHAGPRPAGRADVERRLAVRHGRPELARGRRRPGAAARAAASRSSSTRKSRRSKARSRPAPTGSSSTPSRTRERSPAPTATRVFAAYRAAAERALALGLGVNAGHDLDLENLAVPRREPARPRRGLDRSRPDQRRPLPRPRPDRPRLPRRPRARPLSLAAPEAARLSSCERGRIARPAYASPMAARIAAASSVGEGVDRAPRRGLRS